jgi:hypothetical protein
MAGPLSPNIGGQPTAPTGINSDYWNCEVHALGTGGYEGTVYMRSYNGQFLGSQTLRGESVSQLLLELSAIGRSGGQFQKVSDVIVTMPPFTEGI